VYLQTKGWTTTTAAQVNSYRIEINAQTTKAQTPEAYIQMKMDEPASPSFSDAKVEKYTQNGFDVVKATWSKENNEQHPWGGSAEYYFYKDGKGIYLIGSGHDQSLLDQVA